VSAIKFKGGEGATIERRPSRCSANFRASPVKFHVGTSSITSQSRCFNFFLWKSYRLFGNYSSLCSFKKFYDAIL